MRYIPYLPDDPCLGSTAVLRGHRLVHHLADCRIRHVVYDLYGQGWLRVFRPTSGHTTNLLALLALTERPR